MTVHDYRLPKAAHGQHLPVDGRGKRSPRVMLQLDERDRYLAVAAGFFPGASDREVARRLRTALLRYREGRWRRSRADLTCPHERERIEAMLWMLLKVRDHVPSERLIRMVLGRTH